jgi:hypothetical protein
MQFVNEGNTMNITGPTEEQIRARAFEICLQRGGQPGHALDDWLQAEFELTHLPLRDVHLQPIESTRNVSGQRRRRRGQPAVRFSQQ